VSGLSGFPARKLVHAALSVVAAAAVWLLPHPGGAAILAGATGVAAAVEAARRWSPAFAAGFQAHFGPLLRGGEEHRLLTGATTLAVGCTAAAVLVPGHPAVAGILLAGLADPAAALVGRRFGRHRYPGGKTLEGSLAFFAAGALVLMALPGPGPAAAMAIAAAVALLEAPTLPVDDNLYLPPLGAAIAAILSGAAGLGGFS
jgi:dolichol kinase